MDWRDDSFLLIVCLTYLGMELAERPELKIYVCCAALGFLWGRIRERAAAERRSGDPRWEG